MNIFQEYLKKLKDALFILFLKLSTYKKPLRYFLAVTCGYCLDFIIYALLVNLHISIYLANTIAFCIGSVINTSLIRRFVFRENKFSLLMDLQLSFVSNLIIFLFGMIILGVIVNFGSINPYSAKFLSNLVTFTLNFSIRKYFFRKN